MSAFRDDGVIIMSTDAPNLTEVQTASQPSSVPYSLRDVALDFTPSDRKLRLNLDNLAKLGPWRPLEFALPFQTA